jgi:hypothetical protein
MNLKIASALNASGQIAGRATDQHGDSVAVLLTPVDPPLGDLDHDCTVGFDDFLILLNAWGPCPQSGACPADVNFDGTVSVLDFLIMLANWTV